MKNFYFDYLKWKLIEEMQLDVPIEDILGNWK